MASSQQAPLNINRDVLNNLHFEPSLLPSTLATAINSLSSSSVESVPTSDSGSVLPLNENLASILFQPPVLGPSASPSKKKQQQKPSSFPTSVFQNSFDRISMPPPEADAFTTDSPMKKPPVTVFDTAIPTPFLRKPYSHNALFSQFHASKVMADKENFNNLAGRVLKSIPRRALMEPAPIKEKKVLREKPANISSNPTEPETWAPLEVLDDGKKPPYSYASLIGMAILRTPEKRLTLSQIYKWIGDTFQYYQASNNGWQNSIRHNLSLNKAFVKQERPKGDPGKGNYWAIQQGFEHQFIKNKNSRKATGTKKSKSQQHQTSTSPVPGLGSVKEILPKIEIHLDHSELPIPLPEGGTDAVENGVEELVQLSSDATRSAGSLSPGPTRIADEDDVFQSSSPRHKISTNSSPPHPMCSSPPLTRAELNQSLQEGTPPPLFPSSNLRKRKIPPTNDSGYFSSLESSVLRPSNIDDRPRIKRGRAEEDIARIRQPLHESPTRRSAMVANISGSFLTSSPYRTYDPNPMLPPLTPATTLCPKKPPRSVSPNTNLKIHRDRIRQMVKSPSRDVDILDDNPWGSTLAALACGEFANNDTGNDEIDNLLKDTCYGLCDKEIQKSDVIRNYNKSPDIFNDGFFDNSDFFGVDSFGSSKTGFERFTNECPESPTAGTSRSSIHRSHTTTF